MNKYGLIKFPLKYISIFPAIVLLFFVWSIPSVSAQQGNQKTISFSKLSDTQDDVLKWGLGLRGGVGILTQDLFEGSTRGDMGPSMSGEIFFILNNYITAGLNLEWETHRVKTGSLERGDASTLSILPFYEVRVPVWGNFSPYQVLGIGINLNTFDESDAFQTFCTATYGNTCDYDPVQTVALKVGGGFDYFVTPRWAFNMEIGWRYNSGEAPIRAGGSTVSIEDYDANVFSALVGIRKYF